ncbi:MAG TPA: hypothetical protein VFB34_08495 [Chloroflexota bacterium]|nr:hypothetical protein [Chloroflexota bacterium]
MTIGPERQPGEFGRVEAWLQGLPEELAVQKQLLENLLSEVVRDDRWQWLELGCSLARDRADRWSDLDLGLGIRDGAWPEALDDLEGVLQRLGNVVGLLRHRITGWAEPNHLRFFVQYADNGQIDLVAVPSSQPSAKAPDSIMLYDPDRIRLDQGWDAQPFRPAPALVQEWVFEGWAALADATKYLDRDSPWEALQRLQQARDRIFQLWAVAGGLEYPQFGVTTVLDHPEVDLPAGIEHTAACASVRELTRACIVTVDVLDSVSQAASARVGASPPHALATLVRRRLEAGN